MDWLKTIIKNEAVVAAAKTLGKALLYAALSTIGVSAFSGCSSMASNPRGQTTEIVAVGVPAIAWISHSTQTDESSGGDTNETKQVNPVVIAK